MPTLRTDIIHVIPPHEIRQPPSEHEPSPLIFAIEQGDVQYAKDILDCGADPNMRALRTRDIFDEDGIRIYNEPSNPMGSAIWYNNIKMVELLLNYGADPIKPLTENGELALEVAIALHRDKIVLILLKTLIESNLSENPHRDDYLNAIRMGFDENDIAEHKDYFKSIVNNDDFLKSRLRGNEWFLPQGIL